MQRFEKIFEELIKTEIVVQSLKAAFVLLVGLLIARTIRKRFLLKAESSQPHLMLKRFLSFVVIGTAVAWSLNLLGVDLSVLLGAAGVVTVALGFASQTSASNIISGVFLMTEKAFRVGEIIGVEGMVGEVVAIDMLAVRLRTFDNVMIRVPNETMLKTNVKNLTRFPIRRIDVKISVAYKEDISRVRDILCNVADRNPLCLSDPKPILFFNGYGDSGIDLQFSSWVATSNFIDYKNAIHEEIKAAFDKEGIEIPFPHRTLYTGAVTEPFPVRLAEPGERRGERV